MARALFTIIAAMAELERDLVREQTAAGFEYPCRQPRHNPPALRQVDSRIAGLQDRVIRLVHDTNLAQAEEQASKC
jgi:DNA invertase Pin-like site-specific DNA recombinase